MELLEENEAVKELTVKDGKVQIVVQNEKEGTTPIDPTPDPDKEYEYYWDLYKMDKDTLLPIENVEFKIAEIDETTGQSKENSNIFTTNKDGYIGLKVEKVKAGEYVYKIEETKIGGYKAIKEIKVKVTIGDMGTVEKVELLEENEAVKELKIENGRVKIVIQNEKETKNPDDNDNKDDSKDNDKDDNKDNTKDDNNPNTINPTNTKKETTGNEQKTGIVSTIKRAVSKIPYTGTSSILIILISLTSISGIISYIKYKR